MGTNYVWRTGICPTCGHVAEERHIGKSSGGWCFALHVYPEEGILTLEDWMTKWTTDPQGVIRNEYEEVLSVEEMIAVITKRMWPSRDTFSLSEHWYEVNHAEPGPNGLTRHKIERALATGYSNGCIEHGEGTWDLIIGEFS